MTKHPSNDDFHQAAMAGDVRLFVAGLVEEANEEFSEEIAVYQSDCSELTARTDHTAADVMSISDLACAELDAEARIQAASIVARSAAEDQAEQEQRAFQYEHGITRSHVFADRTLAVALLLMFLFVEGLVNTVFFYSAGFASGIAPAAALGFTIAGVTTILSAGLGGGFFGRFWNYGVHAPAQTAPMRSARLMGRLGSILTSSAIFAVLVVSAIVRTEGEPESFRLSFDVLTEVVTNFHSIMLMLSGTASAILSWRTALSAFSDPYPGFSEASASSATVNTDSQTASQHALDALSGIQIRAMDDLADCADEVAEARREPEADFGALSDEYHRLNGLIDQREAVIRQQAASFLQAQHIIAKATSDFSVDDIKLDDLRTRISAPERPVFDDLGEFRSDYKAAVNALTVAYSAALARLDLADPAAPKPQSSSQA